MHFPEDGIGTELFKRQKLINEMTNLILTKKRGHRHLYFRGPRGSGKTVLLNLIGRQLQSLGHRVIKPWPGFFTSIPPEEIFNLSKSASPKEKIYILVDEVQVIPKSAYWPILLKDCSDSLFTIGAGIPSLEPSPAFDLKLGASKILWTHDDIDKDFLHFCQRTSGIEDMKSIKKAIDWLLAYTGGHGYPFLRLTEHIFSEEANLKDAILSGNIMRELCSEAFYKSELMTDINTRSFSLEKNQLDAAIGIFNHSPGFETNQRDLEKLGYWSSEKNDFISKMFIGQVFQSREPAKGSSPSIDWGNPDQALEAVIKFALENMAASDFTDPISETNRYEDAIGTTLGWHMKLIEGLFVVPQKQIPKSVPTCGKSPTVDFYLNGKLDTYLELVRNGSLLEKHFDRFEQEEGAYYSKKHRYAILDLELDKYQPNEIPIKYKAISGKYWCFVKPMNCLYHGGKLVEGWKGSPKLSAPRSPFCTLARSQSTRAFLKMVL
jgi:hypothetical protein